MDIKQSNYKLILDILEFYYLELSKFLSKYRNVEIKKIILLLGLLILFNGCLQSTAMVGPAMTLASSGNVYQAGLSYSANKAVENETGMSTVEFVTYKIEKENIKRDNKEFIILVKNNFKKTRKIILDQSIKTKD